MAERLLEESRRTGKSFKEVVNETLRSGLASSSDALAPFKVTARDMALRPGIDLDDIEGLLDRIEGPLRR